MIFPILLGLSGTLVLLGLGDWQLDRLEWKTALLAEIDARMQAVPIPIPLDPDPDRHAYLRVSVTGKTRGQELHVLTSDRTLGPGFRIVVPLSAGDGRVYLADLGFVAETKKGLERPAMAIRIEGNLVWPREVDRLFTPDPDLEKNIWFARDVERMAAELGTSPVLVVADRISRLNGTDRTSWTVTRPAPVDANVPNDHLEYAITWFSLACVWSLMTIFWLWRIRRGAI